MSVTEKVELYKFDEEKYLKEGDVIQAIASPFLF